MKANDLLGSYKDDYKVRYPGPYTFIVSNNDQYIYYFGSKHSFDPADSQFKEIKSFWQDFLEKTKKKNCIVFVEGGERLIYETAEESILKQGEMGYITYLAAQENIETFSPEPPGKLIFKALERKFSRNEITYYFFARVCYQWNNLKEKPDFKSYIQRFLDNDKRESGWDDFDFSLENLKKIHYDLFGGYFDENDKQFFYDVINPLIIKTNINRVSREEEEGLRDRYIVDEAEKYWKSDKNIFTIYGKSHAVIQGKAIKYLVQQ